MVDCGGCGKWNLSIADQWGADFIGLHTICYNCWNILATMPKHIPEEQYKRYLRKKIKKKGNYNRLC